MSWEPFGSSQRQVAQRYGADEHFKIVMRKLCDLVVVVDLKFLRDSNPGRQLTTQTQLSL